MMGTEHPAYREQLRGDRKADAAAEGIDRWWP